MDEHPISTRLAAAATLLAAFEAAAGLVATRLPARVGRVALRPERWPCMDGLDVGLDAERGEASTLATTQNR